jgi:hypothetical protein
VGCILYLMLTGRRPFEAPENSSWFDTILTGRITPIEELVEDVPAELASLVGHLLERDATRRLRSSHRLRRQLVAIQAGLAQGGRRVSTSQRKQRRRRDWPARTGGGLPLAVLGLVLAMSLRVASSLDGVPAAIAATAEHRSSSGPGLVWLSADFEGLGTPPGPDQPDALARWSRSIQERIARIARRDQPRALLLSEHVVKLLANLPSGTGLCLVEPDTAHLAVVAFERRADAASLRVLRGAFEIGSATLPAASRGRSLNPEFEKTVEMAEAIWPAVFAPGVSPASQRRFLDALNTLSSAGGSGLDPPASRWIDALLARTEGRHAGS